MATGKVINSITFEKGLTLKDNDSISLGRKEDTEIGIASVATGDSVEASGKASHAEGTGTIAQRKSQHVIGEYNIADTWASVNSRGRYVEIVGNGNTDSRSNARTLDWSGNEYLQGGLSFGAAGNISLGRYENSTTGINSVALGRNVQALGTSSLSEGCDSIARGDYSHAEGYHGEAVGEASHAGGYGGLASGDYSFAHGRVVYATRRDQFVFGSFNEYEGDNTNRSSEKGTYVEIVGNGPDINHRSNARTLDWDGNEVLAGKLTVGANPSDDMDVVTKGYSDTTFAKKINPVFTNSIEIRDSDLIAKLDSLQLADLLAVTSLVQRKTITGTATISNMPTTIPPMSSTSFFTITQLYFPSGAIIPKNTRDYNSVIKPEVTFPDLEFSGEVSKSYDFKTVSDGLHVLRVSLFNFTNETITITGTPTANYTITYRTFDPGLPSASGVGF